QTASHAHLRRDARWKGSKLRRRRSRLRRKRPIATEPSAQERRVMDAPQGHDQNADQIAYWNGAGGQRWADRQPVQDILLQPIADLLIDRARIKPGERVLDVGCGSGST